MSKLHTILPVAGMSGKIDHNSDEYARVVNGKTYYVHMNHKRGPKDFSDHEKAYRRHVGELARLASEINRDPERSRAYDDWRQQGYTKRYCYILARLIHDTPLSASAPNHNVTIT